jgi:hypothetical protein
MNWRGWAFPVVCLAIGSFETVGFLTGKLEPSRRFGMFGAVSLMIGGVIFTALALSSRVILSNDAIERRSILRNKRLLFSEIRGRREIVSSGPKGITSSWTLEPKDNCERPIDISNFFALDDVFYQWFNQLPVLGTEDVN